MRPGVHAAPAWRPIPFSGADGDGLPFRNGRDPLPGLADPWTWHPLCRTRIALHDLDRRADRARRLAGSSHVGGNGARDHGLGTGTYLHGSSVAPHPSATREYSIGNGGRSLDRIVVRRAEII